MKKLLMTLGALVLPMLYGNINAVAQEKVVSFDFTSLENDISYTPGATEENWTADGTNFRYSLMDATINNDGVIISFTKSSSSANNTYYYKTQAGGYDLRFYNNNSMYLTAPDGYQFEEIVFSTIQANSYISKMALPEGAAGTLVNNSTTKIMTWTAPEVGSISEVMINATGTNRIATITVTLAEFSGEELPEPTETTVYVVGSGDGLAWVLPGKEFAGENGVVSFTVSNLVKFKASVNYTTEWDGDNGYNAGCYGTGETSFGDAVYPNGQTLPMVVWGEDLELPWPGDYTITMNFNNNTITAKTTTPKPAGAPDVYVRGDMNSWGTSDDWKFTNVSWDSANNTGVWTINCKIPAGQAFKIADEGWGSINYGGATNMAINTDIKLLYNNGTNLTLAQDFDGTITFTVTKEKSDATVYFAMEGEVSYPDMFYVIGTLQEGVWNENVGVEMTGNEKGVYTAESVSLIESDGYTGFSITGAIGSWDDINAFRFGPAENDTPAIIGENKVDGTGDRSWTIEPGIYKMVFDYVAKTLDITKIGDVVVTPPEVKIPDTLYILGNVNGNNWGTTDGPAAKNEDGMFTWENVEFNDANAGSGYFNLATVLGDNWDVVNGGDRFGAVTNDAPLTVGGTAEISYFPANVSASSCKSWLVAAGTYNVTADLNKMEISLAEATPIIPVYTIAGELTGEMTLDNGIATYVGTPEAADFHIVMTAGSKVTNYGPASVEDAAQEISKAGEYQGAANDNNWTLTSAIANGANEITLSFDTNSMMLTVAVQEPVKQINTVYVVGNGTGMTWDLPGQAFTGENSVVSFSLANVSKFKASINYSNEWDGETGFNAGCYGTGEKLFGNTVYPDGETLPMVAWGEDLELPWLGDYTITMDFVNNTITAKTSTPAPVEAPDIYVRGDMNGWGSTAAYKFENVEWNGSEKSGKFTWTGSINAGQAFKFADANWGSYNYGGPTGIVTNKDVELVYNGGNMTMGNDFEGTVTLTIANGSATAYFAMEGPVTYPDQFYVIGTLEQCAWNPEIGVKMTGNGEGVYTAEEVVLVESAGFTGFAIAANLGDWDTVNALRFGPSETNTPAVLGENTDIAMGDLTWSFTPGAYTMVFNFVERVLTISEVMGEMPDGYLGLSTEGVPTEYNVNYPIARQADGSFTGAWTIPAGSNFNIWIPETEEGAAGMMAKAPAQVKYVPYGPTQPVIIEFTEESTNINFGELTQNEVGYWTLANNEDCEISFSFNPEEGEIDMETETEITAPTNVLAFENFTITVNENATEAVEAEVAINVIVPESEEPFTYKGIQFDVTLPECLTLDEIAYNGAISVNTEYSVTKDMGNNTYRVIGTFQDGTDILENVLTLNVSLEYSDELVGGNYPIEITNVTLSNVKGGDIEFNDYTGYVTVDIYANHAEEIEVTEAIIVGDSYNNIDNMVTSVVVGETVQVTLTVIPEDLDELTTDIVTFTSNNNNVKAIPVSPAEGEAPTSNVYVYTIDTNVSEDVVLPVTVTFTAIAESKDKEYATTTYTLTINPVLLGDSNDNGTVNVADVVTTANYIAELESAVFCFPNANVILTPVDGKQVINTSDLTATVSIILMNWDGVREPAQQSIRRQTRNIVTNDALVVDNFNVTDGQFTIGVSLDNTYDYSALQASVIVPEGMRVIDVTAGPRAAAHEYVANITEDGRVNIVFFSFENASFMTAEGALFNLVVEADAECGNIAIENIQASDAESNGYMLSCAGGQNATSGIIGIDADAENGVRYFNIQGVEVKNPEAGSILIRVENGKAEKVIVK